MVDALLSARVPRWQELNRAIDERDDMLDFALHLFGHDRDRAVANYFQNALDQYTLLVHISRWRGTPGRMLDFASGYGRLTRLLVHEHLAGETTVSDILEGAMEFQHEQFGVRTILSTREPEQFPAAGPYDLIFVASLFSHLPASTFTRWLRRLTELLTPGGLLVFSVHDESLAPEKVDGIAFHSTSESRVLDLEDYGSTFVTEGYVREQVRAIGEDWACIRMPRAMADWQDVYVISPSALPDAAQRHLPKGFVDNFAVADDGVRVSGWATMLDGPVDRVEVRLDGAVVATARSFGPRPDAAAWLGVPGAVDCGFECLLPHSAVHSFRYEVATVSAFSPAGEERILFLGTLDSLDGHVARERGKALQHQLALRGMEITAMSEQLAAAQHHGKALEHQIAAMRASRFWKARDQWFAVKRRMGLTEET